MRTTPQWEVGVREIRTITGAKLTTSLVFVMRAGWRWWWRWWGWWWWNWRRRNEGKRKKKQLGVNATTNVMAAFPSSIPLPSIWLILYCFLPWSTLPSGDLLANAMVFFTPHLCHISMPHNLLSLADHKSLATFYFKWKVKFVTHDQWQW